MKALLIKPNAEGIETLDFPKDNHLDFYYKHLDCDLIDIVKPYGLNEGDFPNYDLIIDDEGMLKAEPQVNTIASLLYGVIEHGQPIFGRAMLVKHEGAENVGMSEKEIQSVIDYLLNGRVC